MMLLTFVKVSDGTSSDANAVIPKNSDDIKNAPSRNKANDLKFPSIHSACLGG